MSKPNDRNYEMARAIVAEGKWRVDPDLGHVIGMTGRPMARQDGQGYLQATMRDPLNWRVQRTAMVHRVIWEAVHGPLEPGLEINHINGDKTDNRLLNLEAVTPSENTLHANRTGLRKAPRGVDCKRGKFTNDFVLAAYRRLRSGEPVDALAVEFGVSERSIRDIGSGRRWYRVTGAPPHLDAR